MAHITWKPNAHKILSHEPGVQRAVLREARQRGSIARGLLAQHRYPYDKSEARIEVTAGSPDAFVSLVDPAAVPIEFGHVSRNKRKWVPGLRIIRRIS